MNARMNQAMGRAKGLAGGFTPGQRGIILVAALGLILGAFALTRWVAQPTWTPLFGETSSADTQKIVEELQAEGAQYKLGGNGNTVMVPQSQLYALRVSVGAKGLPSTTSDSSSWAIFDQQGMTATEIQQNAAYQRAIEGEVAKTLEAIAGVNTAIVKLAIPKDSVFVTEKDKTTASVLLSLAPGTTLSKSQVRSVTNLVATSVPGLLTANVAVSDGNGTLLTAPNDGSSGAAAANANDTDEQTAQFEDRVAAKTQQMLDQVLGAGSAVVRVSAALDFDAKHSTTESYLPSPALPLSEQTSREAFNPGPGGVGGLLGVITPTPLSSAMGTGQYYKDSTTRNNGIGKSIVEAEAAPGAVKRLSVAVVLDSSAAEGVDPATVQALVASAVGIDSTRGDVVQVNAVPFNKAAAEKTAKELAKAEAEAKTAGYIDLGKKGGMGLLIVIAAVILMLKQRKGKAATPTVDATATDLPDGLLVPSRLEAIGADRMRELGAGPAGELGALEQEALSPIIEREKLREEVASFVDSQPDDIAQLVQGWLEQRSN
ncbi:MAG: flagellar M-ring protein FliF [Kineosporiaceae bacterium]|nr:flagellar M-ring protein FliF [Kineosporiaceae bacterium]